MSLQKIQKSVPNKHIHARANFLLQASMLMIEQNQIKLSAFYAELCKRICARATQRIAPSIKRNLCKRCSLPQQPSISAELTLLEDSLEKDSNPSANKHCRKRKRRRNLIKAKEKVDSSTTTSYKSSSALASSATIDEHLHLQLNCMLCGQQRFFRVNSEYKFWLDNPEALESETVLRKK